VTAVTAGGTTRPAAMGARMHPSAPAAAAAAAAVTMAAAMMCHYIIKRENSNHSL